MFDIIGDIHGQAAKLKSLLIKLGYKKTDNGFCHSAYKAIFVGDLIDRGPYQLETLQIVKEMVDNQNAYVVMGNHEFNAIGWSTPTLVKEEQFLREHTPRNYKQHKIFLSEVEEHSPLHHYWIEWFKSLPLFLDLAQIRVIHACWDSQVIEKIKPYLDDNHCLKEQSIQAAFDHCSELFDYCEVLLKGKEISLPQNVYYHDKDGTKRHRSRIKWWLNHAESLNELCLLPDNKQITQLNHKVDINLEPYQETKPVFIGHYWLTGRPAIQTNKVACVDYSAAINYGKLVAYRWQGEENLTTKNFVY